MLTEPRTGSRFTARTVRRTVAGLSALALCAPLALMAPAATAAPALQIPGSSQPLLDQWGRPTGYTQDQITAIAHQPWMPPELRSGLLAGLEFWAGTGEGEPGVEVPDLGVPITQFFWPSRAESCIGGNSASIGSAIAVPGPADLPLPGAGAGETSFVFTALGTGPLAEQQNSAMRVHWANLNTLRHGTTTLGNSGINPDGPSTLSGTAPTGSGRIVAVLEGGLSTDTGAGTAQCAFTPTAVIFDVR